MVLEFTRDEVLIILTAKQSNPHEVSLNPLSPSIHIQILQTDPYTFPLRISRENLIIDQGILSCVIILLILITYLLTVYGYC